jgi:hypothetical protein
VKAKLAGHAGKVPMRQAPAIQAVSSRAAVSTPEGKSWG